MTLLEDMTTEIARVDGQMIWDAVYLGVFSLPEQIIKPLHNCLIVGSFLKLLALAGERVRFIIGSCEAVQNIARAQWGLALIAPATGMSMARLHLDTLSQKHVDNNYVTIGANRTDTSEALIALRATQINEPGPFLWCTPSNESTKLIDMFKACSIIVAIGKSFGCSKTAFRISLMIERNKVLTLIELKG